MLKCNLRTTYQTQLKRHPELHKAKQDTKRKQATTFGGNASKCQCQDCYCYCCVDPTHMLGIYADCCVAQAHVDLHVDYCRQAWLHTPSLHPTMQCYMLYARSAPLMQGQLTPSYPTQSHMLPTCPIHSHRPCCCGAVTLPSTLRPRDHVILDGLDQTACTTRSRRSLCRCRGSGPRHIR